MKRIILPPMSSLHLVSAALLMGWLTASALAQSSNIGLVDDWSSHHVIFSNPGTLQDAMKNGRRAKWERIVNDPRYRMQQARHGLPMAGQTATPAVGLPKASEVAPRGSNPSDEIGNLRNQRFKKNPLHADWSVTISGAVATGVAKGMGPAKYSLSITGTPNCSDYVVFPVDAPGSPTQANLVGVINLYSGTCSGGPTVQFAYHVGSGSVQTSPVLSLDGTKVAFVETTIGPAVFHVLTLDLSGNAGCPTSPPCNGGSFDAPQTPGGNLNSAADFTIQLSPGSIGGPSGDTRSSPFVDYASDTAYVGDDNGQLHKITGVFNGTPTEAGSPWPVSVLSVTLLASPVFDSVSQKAFVGSNDGNLYCVTALGTSCGSISVGDGIFDAPIVDAGAQTVFTEAQSGTRTVLTQAPTSLVSPIINVDEGKAGRLNVFRGAFDHAYFTDTATGHMYFCGNLDIDGTPALYRVGFNGSGTINATNDGSSFQLVTTGNTGESVDCTPLTEVFNTSTSQGIDYLFVGVLSHGAPAGCSDLSCVMSFDITSGFPTTGPQAVLQTATAVGDSSGMSGMIIDNVSNVTGTSNIYFGNLQNGTGVQASQSALK